MSADSQLAAMTYSTMPSSLNLHNVLTAHGCDCDGNTAGRHEDRLVTDVWNDNVVVDRNSMNMYNDAPFAGYYEDVVYPVCTLFKPPQAPGSMPPQVKIMRPPKLWLNDLTRAGDVEKNAQCIVSRIWRGVLCRRQLYNDRAYEQAIIKRASKIQLWWRILQSQRQRKMLESVLEEWLCTQAQQYTAERLRNLASMQKWQRQRLDKAAVVIQRTVRWLLNNEKAQQNSVTVPTERSISTEIRSRENTESMTVFDTASCAVPEYKFKQNQTPYKPFRVEDVLGIERNKRPYFPWRVNANRVSKGCDRELHDTDDRNINATDVYNMPQKQLVRTILNFKSVPDRDLPVPQEVVEEINAQGRVRDEVHASVMADHNVKQRIMWKKEGLRRDDLDFNVEIIQRLYRSCVATTKRSTRQLTSAYMQRTVNIIVRSFRMYCLIKKMQSMRRRADVNALKKTNKLSSDKIMALHTDAVWGKELMDLCATEIQRCWRYYYFTTYCTDAHSDRNNSPTPNANNALEIRERDRKSTDMNKEKTDVSQRVKKNRRPVNKLSTIPEAPPYNLIDSHRKRVAELRLATMSQQEKFQYEVAKKHKCVHFCPVKTISQHRVHIFLI